MLPALVYLMEDLFDLFEFMDIIIHNSVQSSNSLDIGFLKTETLENHSC